RREAKGRGRVRQEEGRGPHRQRKAPREPACRARAQAEGARGAGQAPGRSEEPGPGEESGACEESGSDEGRAAGKTVTANALRDYPWLLGPVPVDGPSNHMVAVGERFFCSGASSFTIAIERLSPRPCARSRAMRTRCSEASRGGRLCSSEPSSWSSKYAHKPSLHRIKASPTRSSAASPITNLGSRLIPSALTRMFLYLCAATSASETLPSESSFAA